MSAPPIWRVAVMGFTMNLLEDRFLRGTGGSLGQFSVVNLGLSIEPGARN
jgi:hypothetical protein